MTNKASRTVDQQIELLKQRGMSIDNEQFARHQLGHISYYRLKGYWWSMQKDTTHHLFKQGSCFEAVIQRYRFDKELRLVLFDAIESIEIALRTKMIYYLSLSYGGLYYKDNSLFFNKTHHQEHLEYLMADFYRSSEIFAKEYKYKYGKWDSKKCISLREHPDAWIIFEVASFGTLSKIYKNLNHQLPEKAKIANDFGLYTQKELSSWLEAISYLRNIIAHHSRLWGRNMVKVPMNINNPKKTWLKSKPCEKAQKRPFFVISAMLYLCNAINEGESFKEKILSLLDRNPDIPIHEIGFIDSWKKEPLWSN